ncbi:DAK2 domain-containing protein [Nonomuraea longicatena]|uniref:DhaL domain-containing protein n=1 Tax=Nonomuraea longicatena TaxID=83682 RepID=A0ABN1NTT1_9ACTN
MFEIGFFHRCVTATTAAATTPLLPRKRRTCHRAERTLGHQDPGATSSAQLIVGLAEVAGA